MMAIPFRALALRQPTTTTFLLSSSRAALCRQTLSPLQQHIRRAASGLSESAKKAPNAAKLNTATKLAADPGASGASASEVSRTNPNPPPPGHGKRIHSTSAAAAAAPSLTWDNFFKLRLQRRRIQLIFSVIAGIGGAGAGAVALQSGLQEPLLSQVPLDPFITLGMVVMACGAMGWLLGPILGSQVFYIINSSRGAAIRAKESEFLTRVRKNRSDPTNSSAGNPGTFPLNRFFGRQMCLDRTLDER